MDIKKDTHLVEEYSCNSAMTVLERSGNPRLSIAEWSDIKFIECHGAYSIYTATRYGRKYFLKTLSESHRDLQEWQRLLFKEFELGFQFDHPNIARTVGWEKIPTVGETIVMEYIDGQELGEWLKTDNVHTSEDRLNVVKQIAEALKYVHSLGISHRDLKPDNILITHKGIRVKIIDFGLGDGDDFIVYKKAAGTEAYGAPEQVNGKGESSMSADIYSLGKIMKIMLPGLRYRHIINKCLKEDASSRPAAAEVLKSLNKESHAIPVAIGLAVITLLAAVGISYNIKEARTREAIVATQTKAVPDTVYIQKTDTIWSETSPKPTESAIKAVWDKALKDIEPQIKFFATFDFPNPEEHKNDIDDLISRWGEHLYFSLLEIGCTEETATAKRKKLGNYMRRRFNEYQATRPTQPSDSLQI